MLFEFLAEHQQLIGWLGALSVLIFFGSLVLIPWLIARIPVDYFQAEKRFPFRAKSRYPKLDRSLTVLKNILGIVFILAGLAMLFLPGQGLLTLLVGMMMSNFPGKYKLERKIVAKPSVLKTLNWIRRKYKRPPLATDPLQAQQE